MGILRTDKISGLEKPTPVTGSVVFDGTGDYLSLADSNDFTLAKNDFTFECWLYATGDVTSRRFFGQIDSGGSNGNVSIRMGFNGSDLLLASVYEGSTEKAITAGFIAEDRWYHIAFVRDGSTLRSFIDGVQQGTLSFTGSVNDSSNQMAIGRLGEYDGSYFTGYISNLRLLKGTALYTSDFTPPVHELEVIGDTVLLCCNNSDSAGAEGTGKSITVNGNAAASTFSPGLTRDFTSGTEFRGVTTFDTQGYFVPPSGTTTDRNRTGGRGISLGGAPSPSTARSEVIDYITISSMGNSQDFGNLTVARSLNGGCSSSTRGICAGGYNEPVSSPGYLDTIDYITIAATGNAVDFGNLTVARNGLSGTSNSTRGVFAGGSKPPSDTKENVIDYLTIATLGNAINFGDLSQLKRNTGCTGSATRAIWAGGQVGPTITNVMDYVTIASTGDAADFGDLTANRRHCIGSSSSTRGIFAGGTTNPTLIDIIEYVTISSLGNSQDFGNLTDARSEFGGPSNKIRAVFMGGWDSPVYDNRIDYITIASTGDALDFGNLGGGVRGAMAGISDSHGGIS
jgi:hypothetical protein